jgi:hypothetical protein
MNRAPVAFNPQRPAECTKSRSMPMQDSTNLFYSRWLSQTRPMKFGSCDADRLQIPRMGLILLACKGVPGSRDYEHDVYADHC